MLLRSSNLDSDMVLDTSDWSQEGEAIVWTKVLREILVDVSGVSRSKERRVEEDEPNEMSCGGGGGELLTGLFCLVS